MGPPAFMTSASGWPVVRPGKPMTSRRSQFASSRRRRMLRQQSSGRGRMSRSHLSTQNSAAKHQQAWAEYVRQPVVEKSPTGIEMTLIPPGGGKMSQPWRLGKYEVTQAQFTRVMGWNPSHFVGERAKGIDSKTLPADSVRWYVALEFCNELSKLENLKPYYEIKAEVREGKQIVKAQVDILGGDGYRLPTQLEWEYACRAGSAASFGYSDRYEDLDKFGWHEKNSGGHTHKVGEKLPNAFGLFDMHGNRWGDVVGMKRSNSAAS